MKKPPAAPRFWTKRDQLRRDAKKRIALTLFPTYSRLVDNLNYNAKLAAFNRANAQVPKFSKKTQLYEMICATVIHNEPIDYFELGVHTGGSFRQWLSLNHHPSSRFFGFDSFEGLPEDWSNDFVRGSFDLGGVAPALDDQRGRFVKGWFQDTLPPFLDSYEPLNRLVINIDCDLYSSSLFSLASLDRFMREGTVIVFDEFGGPLHEFRSYLDYVSSFMRKTKCIGMANSGEHVAFLVEARV